MDASQSSPELNRKKDEIRRAMRERLVTVSLEQRAEWSKAACARLVRSPAFQNATVIMLYMPMRSEVDVLPAALEAFRLGKSICVPRVESGRTTMNAIATNTFDDESMTPDAMGVRVPKSGNQIPDESIDLVVVPGVAFDARGARLGRGGGFYDRYLASLKRNTSTIGICFDMQFVDSIPVDRLDVCVKAVVSDRRGVQPNPKFTVLSPQDLQSTSSTTHH